MNRCSARYLGGSLSSQLWCQKRALLPFPIVIVVEALKSSRSRSVPSPPKVLSHAPTPATTIVGARLFQIWHPPTLPIPWPAYCRPIYQAMSSISVLLPFPKKGSSKFVNFLSCPYSFSNHIDIKFIHFSIACV